MTPDDVTSDEAAAVFRRAAELDQHKTHDPGMGLDLAALEQAGMEAGLSRASIRQALAEVRAGAPAPGQPDAVVARTLNSNAPAVARELERFMHRQNFRVLRRLEDRTVWVPDRSLAAAIRKVTDWNRRIVLSEATRVTTCVVAVPSEDRAHVRFEIDIGAVRWGWYAMPIAVGAAGAVGVAAAVVLGTAPEVLIAAPGAVALTGGAYAGARAGIKGSVRRNANGIERFLDHLEHGR
jgi:hypothetical protein